MRRLISRSLRSRLRSPITVHDLEPRTAPAVSVTASLLKNINTGASLGSTPNSFANVNGFVYFAANDGTIGTELWKSDGTSAGTVPVKDINPGVNSSTPTLLTNVNGTLFFRATDGTSGVELWKSDGTSAGTVRVADIFTGASNSNPTALANVNGKLFFGATDATSGTELWMTDGTTTTQVANINAGTGNFAPSYLTNVNGTLFFRANDGTLGIELWKSDGTSTGTVMVLDINPGAATSAPLFPVNINGTLYFRASDGTSGVEPWKSNGTSTGTVRVADLNPGAGASNPSQAVNVNGMAYFNANDGTSGVELWRSDGTAPGTIRLADINPGAVSSSPAELVNVSGRLLFSASDGTSGIELWKVDAGVVSRVADIRPGALNSAPSDLVNANGTLVFRANDGFTGIELWQSDGATAKLVADINPGIGASSPQGFVLGEGLLVFQATDLTNGAEVWLGTFSDPRTPIRVTDVNSSRATDMGSSITLYKGAVIYAGTDGLGGREVWSFDGHSNVRLADIVVGAGSSNPIFFTEVNGILYFAATSIAFSTELWKTDGTSSGTVQVADINPTGASTPRELTNLNGTLMFRANDGTSGFELWKSDGTSTGTVRVADIQPGAGDSYPQNLCTIGSTLFFCADDGSLGFELWKSDGSTATLVKDIEPGSDSGNPLDLINVNGLLYFRANDAAHGSELWSSNGTSAGTTLVADIAFGSTSSGPVYLANVAGTLYFRASDHITDSEPWRSDGTSAGTWRIADINQAGSSNPRNFVDLNGQTFFMASDGTNGPELWRTAGTPLSTERISDISTGLFFGVDVFEGLFNLNGQLLFTADDGTSGSELWHSDGTPAGTKILKDIRSGRGRSDPEFLRNLGGTLYFAANDGNTGTQLWKSDGTAAGTERASDLRAGSVGSDPVALTNVNGSVYFVAEDNQVGPELWKTDGNSTTLIADTHPGQGNGLIDAPNNLANVDGILFFAADDGLTGREPWRSDGTPAGTHLLRDINNGAGDGASGPFINVNGVIFFAATDFNGTELWKYDRVTGGTSMVRNIAAGSANSSPTQLTNVNGVLFFTANDGTNGAELWKSNGTAGGTVMVRDIRGGANSSSPSEFINVGGSLYFSANDGASGDELWKSDGTSAGTVLVRDIRPLALGSGPDEMANIGGLLYFLATDGTNGYELWKSDGTSAGTVMVRNIFAGASSSSAHFLTNVNGVLFFAANDGTNGIELWKSDGTSIGTTLVSDIHAGSLASVPNELTNVNGQIYFRANDGTSGHELWRSDGKSTTRVADLRLGALNSFPQFLVNAEGTLYFVADDGFTGPEVWALQPEDSVPFVTLVSRSHKTIADHQVGISTFQLDVQFSEPMNTSIIPTVSFPVENPATTLVGAPVVTWASVDHLIAAYSVADVNTVLNAIDWRLAGGKDLAGNLLGTVDLVNVFSIDTVNPNVNSIVRVGPAVTNTSTVSWTITFSEAVTGVEADNFTLITSGLGATPAITSVTGGGITWTVTASTGTGDGKLLLNLTSPAGIDDVVGNDLTGTLTGQSFTVERTAPTVNSITRLSGNPNKAATVQWSVTFSESVTGLTAGNFALPFSGLSTPPAVSNVSGSGTNWTITATTGTGDGTLGLDLATSTSVSDVAGNAVANVPFTGQTFTMDRTAPTVVSITRTGASLTNANEVSWTVTFSEVVGVVGLTNFTLVNSGLGSGPNLISLVGSGASRTVTASTGTGVGTLQLNLSSPGAAVDLAGNALVAPFNGETYSIDHTAPLPVAVVRDDPQFTKASIVRWSFYFDEPMLGVSTSNFKLTNDVTVGSPTILSVIGAGTVWQVTATTSTGSGAVYIELNNSNGMSDLAGNKVITLPFFDLESVYFVDRTAPSVTGIKRNGSDITNAGMVSWTVSFNEPVSGVNGGNFALVNGGLGGSPQLASMMPAGFDILVSATTGSGDGTLGLNLVNGFAITDRAGNLMTGTFTGQAFTLDRTAPAVTKIERLGQSPTNGAEVNWRVDFSEILTPRSFSNFELTISGLGGNPIITVVNDGGSKTSQTFITASTGSGDGEIGLNVVSGDGVTDLAGNPLVMTSPFVGPTFIVDRTPATVLSIVRNSAALTNAGSVSWTVNFSELVFALSAANLELSNTGLGGSPAITSVVPNSPTSFTVSATTGTGDGSLGLNLLNTTGMIEPAGNPILGAPFTGPAYTLDRTVPTVTSVLRLDPNPSSAATVNWKVSFSEAVSTVNIGNFLLDSVGLSGNVSISSVVHNGNSATVAAATGGGLGFIRLDWVNSLSTADAAGNLVPNGIITGETYGIDHVNPTVISVTPNLTTVADANVGTSKFTLTVIYPDTMNTAINPVISFPVEDPGSALTLASANWPDAKTFVAKYDVADTDLDLSDIDVRVEGAQDVAGNVQTIKNAPDVFRIDTRNPLVAAVIDFEGTPASANSIPFYVAFDAEHVNGVTAANFKLSDFGTISPTPAITSVVDAGFTSAGWTWIVNVSSGTSGAGVVTLEMLNTTGITDDAGNAAVFVPGQDEVIIDHVGPTIISIVRTGVNPAASSTLEWKVTFSETVFDVFAGNFAIVKTGTVAAASISKVTTVDVIEYTVTAKVALDPGDAGTVRLDWAGSSGPGAGFATDSSGNPVTPSSFAGEAYDVSRLAPSVSAIIPSVSMVGDAQAGAGKFTLSAVFDNSMDASVAPVISFPVEDPGAAFVFAGGAWIDAKTYRAAYTVNDFNATLANIDVRVTGGKSAAFGDSHGQSDKADVFSFDLQNPIVVAISRDDPTHTKLANIDWTVVFSEPVSGVTAANFTLFNGGLGGLPTLTNVAGSGTTWSVTASTGSGEGTLALYVVDTIDVFDAAGNNLAALPVIGPTYAIDHVAPAAAKVSANTLFVTDAEVGPAGFQVTVVYNEPMNVTVNPSVTFPVENPGATLTFASGVWLDVKTYRASFAVSDLQLNLADVDISITGAMDAVGNIQEPLTVADFFDIEMGAGGAKVTQVRVNDGSAQRSRVTSLLITFDLPLTFVNSPAVAFQLKRQSDNKAVNLAANVDNSSGASVVTLTFTGGAVNANSLADGRYTLTALASEIVALDGNSDGKWGDDFVLVGDPAIAPKLYRLFGDSDGDNDVDTTDFGAFRASYGGTNNIFDFDNDGDVDTGDFGAFRARYGGSV